MRLIVIAAAVGFLLPPSGGASGQSPCLVASAPADPMVVTDTALGTGTLKGWVVGWAPSALDTGNVVRRYAGIIVTDRQTARRTTTAVDGSFMFRGLTAGVDTLTARFIGYVPSAVVVHVPECGGIHVLIVMKASDVVVSHDSF